MSRIRLYLIFTSIFISGLAFAQSPIKSSEISPLSIGESIEFKSETLEENRRINVYLPVGYSSDSSRKYPVIYLLDGSMDEDFIHIAGLVQFGSFSWINMLPESIVVGISNVDRKRDFTFPTTNKRDKKDFPTTGSSENFIQFLEAELQPLIEEKYRTTSTNTLIGQSLGGLLATEILFKKPNLFDNYIIVSPSLWWDDESLLKYTPVSYNTSKSIYIGVGKEGEIMERIAKELYIKLQPSDSGNTNVYFEYFEEQNHGDALHLAVYDAFEKIFRREN
jgi:predicted alpha/beta superfamily hydrolase